MEIKKIQELPTYVSEFYKSLSGCKSKPAILFIIPKKLSGFYDQLKENSLNYFEFCNLGNSLDINVSPQQQSNVEKLTRVQANSKNGLIIEVVG